MADDGMRLLEYGRYKLWHEADGGILIMRTLGTCENCQSCGCGERAEPVPIPAAVAKVMMGQAVELSEVAALLRQMPPGAMSPMGLIRRLTGRGRADNGTGGSGGAETAEGGDPAVGDLAGILAAGLPGQESGGEPGDGSQGTAGTV